MTGADDSRRPDHMPPGSMCVVMAYKPSDAEWSQKDCHWREPQDVAACLANCLDYARLMRQSGVWAWTAVTVTYGEEE